MAIGKIINYNNFRNPRCKINVFDVFDFVNILIGEMKMGNEAFSPQYFGT